MTIHLLTISCCLLIRVIVLLSGALADKTNIQVEKHLPLQIVPKEFKACLAAK